MMVTSTQLRVQEEVYSLSDMAGLEAFWSRKVVFGRMNMVQAKCKVVLLGKISFQKARISNKACLPRIIAIYHCKQIRWPRITFECMVHFTLPRHKRWEPEVHKNMISLSWSIIDWCGRRSSSDFETCIGISSLRIQDSRFHVTQLLSTRIGAH